MQKNPSMTPVTFFSLCLCSLWLGCESDPLLVVDFNEVFALSDISLRTGIAVDSRSETLFVTSNGYILTEDADSAEWELFTLWSRPDGSGVTARDVAFSAATGRVVALGALRHSPVATFDPDTGEMGPPVPVPEDVLPLEAPRLLAISDARPDVAWIVDGEIGVVEMNLSTGERRVLLDAAKETTFTRAVGGLAVNEEGTRLWLTRPGSGQVWTRDLVEDRDEVVSGPVMFTGVTQGESAGSGLPLQRPMGIVWVAEQQKLLVADRGVLLWIDPTTGDREYLSGNGVGTGPELSDPQRIALLDGRALVTDKHLNRIVSVDLREGTRSVFRRGTPDD